MRIRARLRLYAYAAAELYWTEVAAWAERYRQRFALCSHCGRNRYFDPPCIPPTVEDSK